jgi:hypothetical protein
MTEADVTSQFALCGITLTDVFFTTRRANSRNRLENSRSTALAETESKEVREKALQLKLVNSSSIPLSRQIHAGSHVRYSHSC